MSKPKSGIDCDNAARSAHAWIRQWSSIYCSFCCQRMLRTGHQTRLDLCIWLKKCFRITVYWFRGEWPKTVHWQNGPEEVPKNSMLSSKWPKEKPVLVIVLSSVL